MEPIYKCSTKFGYWRLRIRYHQTTTQLYFQVLENWMFLILVAENYALTWKTGLVLKTISTLLQNRQAKRQRHRLMFHGLYLLWINRLQNIVESIFPKSYLSKFANGNQCNLQTAHPVSNVAGIVTFTYPKELSMFSPKMAYNPQIYVGSIKKSVQNGLSLGSTVQCTWV